MIEELVTEYQRIGDTLEVKYHQNEISYNVPVNFNESMSKPRHRWFPYKEGFSPNFVQGFIEQYAVEKENTKIIDPFSGVGTTVLEAAKMGCHGLGIEVSSMSHFIAKTKSLQLNDLEIHYFKSKIDLFLNNDLKEVAPKPTNSTVNSYFKEEHLEALLKVKAFYLNETEGKIKQLFKLAFLNLIEPFSTHQRAGNGVKKKRKSRQSNLFGDALSNIKQVMKSKLLMMLEDLEKSCLRKAPKYICGNSLDKNNYPKGKFNAVLTSPPYANCFDYSKIYMRELWLGDFFVNKKSQQNFRMNSLRSHVHATWPDRYVGKGSKVVENYIYPRLQGKDLWSKKIPDMIKGYFEDLGELLSLLNPVLKTGSPVGFVVSNSVYGETIIATDLLITEISKNYGFQPIKIEVYRNFVPSSQQYVKIGDKSLVRESLVILKKE